MTASWGNTTKGDWSIQCTAITPFILKHHLEKGRLEWQAVKLEIFHQTWWGEGLASCIGEEATLVNIFYFWWLCEQSWFDFLWRLVNMIPPLSLLSSASTSLKFHSSLLFLPFYTTYTGIQTHVQHTKLSNLSTGSECNVYYFEPIICGLSR